GKVACFKSGLSPQAIEACGEATVKLNSKVACFKSGLSAKSIKACGKATSNVALQIACFSLLESKATESPLACSAEGHDDWVKLRLVL
ncbi:MAG: hypothetical protein HY074_09845, partial [Deltaproteobacteria bacterium]|nr:hypothetical protein [Deltaproteobacteria bacterium]